MAEIRVEPVRRKRGLTWLWALLALVVVAAIVVWWLYQQGTINFGGY
jgi:multidrug resistance efflux pump